MHKFDVYIKLIIFYNSQILNNTLIICLYFLIHFFYMFTCLLNIYSYLFYIILKNKSPENSVKKNI